MKKIIAELSTVSLTEIQIARSRALQRYYPWVVIGIAFLTVAVAFGARNAFAVFLVSVIEEFHWSRGLASGALMLGSVMWTLSAPVIGVLLDRLGPRIVMPGGAIIMAIGFVITGLGHTVVEYYIGMGVFMGVGFAALPMTSQATFLSNWFVRKRGMAIGLAASGIGLGILLVVPWTQWLIASYGWRAALFILAGVLAVIIAPVNFFFQRQRPEEMNLQPDFGQAPPKVSAALAKAPSADGPSLKEALRTWRFWAFGAGVLAGAIPLHMVLIHQVAAVGDAGFSKELAALALGLIGLFTAPAMIFMGLLADRIGRQWSYALGSASLMMGILFLMLMTSASQTWLFYAFPPFIAFGFSSRQSLYPTIAADLFHGKSFGAIIGAIARFIGAGAGIGPWLGGLIHDWTGGYYWAFCVAQAMTFASVGFIWMAGSSRKN
ncbi:MAG TPA: MFS transporter [Candidatus Binatia bacterium]|nr:MFS transporter [Candidatus Binatia bacterium]